MATIGARPPVPRPEVFPLSYTALPEKTMPRLSGARARGRSCQCIRSLLTAWDQWISPHWGSGPYWAKRWYFPPA